MKRCAILSAFVLFGVLAACDDRHTDFDHAHVDTIAVLSKYADTGDPNPVARWLTTYHGEAGGHQVRISTVAWLSKHPALIAPALAAIPDDEFGSVSSLLAFAATDSGQTAPFEQALSVSGDPRALAIRAQRERPG